MDDDYDKELIRLREKQALCKHTLFKCPACGLHKDNLRDEQRLKIEYLTNKITEYEAILTSLGFLFSSYKNDPKYDKIRVPPTAEIILTIETTVIDTTP